MNTISDKTMAEIARRWAAVTNRDPVKARIQRDESRKQMSKSKLS